MTTSRTLKINRKYAVIQTGNQLSGNTYPVKDWIKTYCGGKWDANSKTWIVDEAKIDEWISKSVISVINTAPAAAPKIASGWCNKCQSYCYGDCEATR